MVMDPNDIAALSGMYDNAGALQQKKIANDFKLGMSDIQNRYKIAMLQSGDSRANIAEARQYHQGLLAQAAAEMQNIGIPKVAIDRFVAESNDRIAQGELAIKQQMANLSAADLQFQKDQFAKQFPLTESAVTGTYNGSPTQAAIKQQNDIIAQQQQTAQGWASISGYGPNGAPTLAREQFLADQAQQRRQYALSVAQYGSQLSAQPDMYFQARRFQGMMAPRLLGADTSGTAMTGSPTPQINTMGALLSGQDPAAAGYVPPPTFDSYGAYGAPAPPTAAGGAPSPGVYSLMADNGLDYQSALNRYAALPPDQQQQAMARGQQLQQAAAAAAPAGGGRIAPAAYGATPDSSTVYAGGGGAWNEQTSSYSGSPYGGPSGGTMPSAAAPAGQPAATGAAADQDPRAKTVSQIAKASPPSVFDGLDAQDQATLKLMQSIYAKGGQASDPAGYLQMKQSPNYGIFKSAGSLLGYNPAQYDYDFQAYRPSQGSSLGG